MNKLNYKILLALFFISNFIMAQNYNDGYRLSEQTIDFDARTLALGNSTIATFGNFSSALINPAGLGTIRKNILKFGINSSEFDNSVSFFNNLSNSQSENTDFSQFSLVLPLPAKKGSAVLAFGYQQTRNFNSALSFSGFNSGNNSMIQDLTAFNEDIAFELGVSYPVYDSEGNYLNDETSINGNLRQIGSIKEDGQLKSWIMSGALEISKDVFLGATFNIISGNYLSNRNYTENDYEFDNYTGLLDPQDSSTLGFESFKLNDIIDWNISGWDLRLGLLYKPNSALSFGATVKLPSTFNIEESYSIYGKSYFSNNVFAVDQPGTINRYEISTPMEISAGFSALLPLVRVNASAKLVDYSQIEFKNGFDEEILISKNDEIKEVFERVINYNIGLEVTLPYPTLKLRGGFIYNPSPFKGDIKDYDKKYFTAGVGFPVTGNILLDLAYIHGWWNDFGDNYGVEVSRTYQDINVDKLVMTISYSFM